MSDDRRVPGRAGRRAARPRRRAPALPARVPRSPRRRRGRARGARGGARLRAAAGDRGGLRCRGRRPAWRALDVRHRGRVLATGGSTLALIHAASATATAPAWWAIAFFVAAQVAAVAAGLALVQALVLRRSTMAPAEVALLARRNGCALVAAGVTMFSAGAAVPGRGSAVLLLAGPALVCVALVAVLRARSLARRLDGARALAVRPPLEDLRRLSPPPGPARSTPAACCCSPPASPRPRAFVRDRVEHGTSPRRSRSPASRRWRSSRASSCSAPRWACGAADLAGPEPVGVGSAPCPPPPPRSTSTPSARATWRPGTTTTRAPWASCITEDIVWEDPALPGPARGVAAVQEFMRGSWVGFPDLRFDETDSPHRTAEGDQVAWRWRMRGTMSGPLDPPGFAPTGPLDGGRGRRPVDDARRAHRALPRLLRRQRPGAPARHRAAAGQPRRAGDGPPAAPAGADAQPPRG